MMQVIFDMDGVIVDSELHWNMLEELTLKKSLPGWTSGSQQKLIGLNIFDTYEFLKQHHGFSGDRQEFLDKCHAIAMEVYTKKTVLTEGFLECIVRLRKAGARTALASSSLRPWIDRVLDRFGLETHFDAVVSAPDSGLPGKPNPHVFLEAARQIGAEPVHCAVIEDSAHGVAAAKAAGMYCFGFRNGFNEKQDLSKADEILRGFGKNAAERILKCMPVL